MGTVTFLARAVRAATVLVTLTAVSSGGWSATPVHAQIVDTDGDGLADNDEAQVYGTDPYDYDTDQDGTPDGVEIAAGTDPMQAPAAGQGADSDGDGLLDIDEAYTLHTNPVAADSDGDGILDGQELALGLDPINANLPEPVGPAPHVLVDTDGDGLYDVDEINVYGTDPDNSDIDGDGRNDAVEVLVDGTDPWVADAPVADTGMEEEPADDPNKPPDFEPAPGVLHGNNGLPADTGGGGGGGAPSGDDSGSGPCVIDGACDEGAVVQEEDRQNNNAQP
jgi:hypothetical protein